MSFRLPPNGTRGLQVPSLLGPVMKLGSRIPMVAHRLLGDRMRVRGRPLVYLTTIGSKTGRKRSTMLSWFPDPAHPEAKLVVGSGGGSARHPSWCYNLARNPDRVWLGRGGKTQAVNAEMLAGQDRVEAWKRVVELAPGYGPYETKTDRELPIIRLIPAN